MLRFTVLGSGSRGNCSLLETEDACVLIDAGFSCKQIELRLQSVGRSLSEVDAIFLTHEHSDHVRGLPVIAKKHQTPIFANLLTREFVAKNVDGYDGWRDFHTGDTVTFRDLTIETFAVPHDAYDPVGFLFRHRLGDVGFLTDLGYATRLVIERVRCARALVLEANHDMKLLQQDTKRPWSVKQRIMSRHGHLSNEAAGEVAAQLLGSGVEDIFLGHLSPDCNEPDIARQEVETHLSKAQAESGQTRTHIRLHDTSLDTPSTSLSWK